MKIVILSDIHSNFAALKALPERDFDQIWCLGDIVDYGPKPHEVIQWIQDRATYTVRGNHDHAVGFDVDPECSAPFRRLATETRRFTQTVCTDEAVSFLRNLPVQREALVNGTRFYLVHAVPTNPLFGYCVEKSPQWEMEAAWAKSDILLVGHTHTPFIREVGGTVIVNPGSLGQPKTGRSEACYAVWEDGKISLREYKYPVVETIRDIRKMPISAEDQDGLISVLEVGVLPPRHYLNAIAASQ
jgi:putative phosphoesterase